MQSWSRETTVMCMRHEVVYPLTEELEWSLRRAACRGFWRGTTLATTTLFLVVYLWLLSQVEVV
jgi:hypothetical protein